MDGNLQALHTFTHYLHKISSTPCDARTALHPGCCPVGGGIGGVSTEVPGMKLMILKSRG